MGLRKEKCCPCHKITILKFGPEPGRSKVHCSSGHHESWSRSLPWKSLGERQPPTAVTLIHESSCPACPEPKACITLVGAQPSQFSPQPSARYLLSPPRPRITIFPTPALFPMASLSWVASPLFYLFIYLF